MAERGRPRDLYDIINLFRRSDLRPEPRELQSLLADKCGHKRLPVPTLASLLSFASQGELADGGYVAITPELEGVSAFGDTPAAALSELVVARDLWLEELRVSGHEAPAPLSLPRYSGQFRLRLPRSLHAWLAARAELEGVSLNTLIVQLLSEAHGQDRGLRAEALTSSPAASS